MSFCDKKKRNFDIRPRARPLSYAIIGTDSFQRRTFHFYEEISVIAVIFVLGACLAASAQDLAGIVGTVTDPSGAVIAGAQVTVANVERGFTRTVASNSDGEYSVVRMPIGNYTISAEKAGFEKLLHTGITLDAGQTLRVKLQLKVGSSTQEIVVTTDPVRVETETGAVSHVVNSTQVG